MTNWRTLTLYALPALVKGYMLRMMVLYAMKFATDVLLVAPFIVGTIFAISRFWDAVSDPIAGILSDKTSLSFGRRRSWILGGAVPLTLTFVMVFSIPAELGPTGTITWLAVAVLGFYTAYTCITVPHLSWGTELSSSSADRNRIFGARHVAESLGGLAALGTLALMIQAESTGMGAARTTAGNTALIAAAIALIALSVGVLGLKERSVAVNLRPRTDAVSIFKAVWANPHARLVIVVILVELIGASAMGAMALYVAQYVMNAAWIAPIAIGLFTVVQIASVPVWVRLADRIEKHLLWRYAMIGSAITYGSLFLLAFLQPQSAQIALNLVAVFFAGFAASCAGTIGPSVVSDIIDYDELKSGERREGAYFSAWSFAQKSAGGITIAIVGVALSGIGFEPNVEQTQLVKVGMAALLGLFPLVCYSIGAWMFSKYTLDEAKRQQIRAGLDARAQAQSA